MRISLAFLLTASTAIAHPRLAPPGAFGGGPPSHQGPPPSQSSAATVPQNMPGTNGFRSPSVAVSRGGKAVCVNGFVTVEANTTKNTKFNFAVPPNQTVVTNTIVEYITSGSPFLESIAAGYNSVGGTFDIRATLCTPVNNTKPSQVQLLTHGVGFDRSYWDWAPGYSYVDVAAEHGHASFFYDRLGVGESSKADPINVVQAALQIETAHQLAVLLRGGKIADTAFAKVVGVGHSFGSIISNGVTALYPSAFDATILTGFSVNASGIAAFAAGGNFAIANENQPRSFGSLNNGYLVDGSIISNQINFFRFPGFDPAVLAKAEATKGTVTFGELFTQGSAAQPAPGYTGPLAVVDGAEDLPFCSGNCKMPTNLAAAVQPKLYPAVSTTNFATYLAPVTGHGLNLHYSAETAYEWIQDFLASHNL